MLTRRRLIEGAAAVAGTTWLTRHSPAQTTVQPASNPTASFDPRNFGAKGDGKTLDTAAVQDAIDACHAAGGGYVTFAPALTFLIGTIYLKDNVTLQLAPNSTLLGSDSLADYGNDVGLNPFYPEVIDPCLIYAKNATSIGIVGEGKVVGHGGNNFTPPPGADPHSRAARERPMLLRFDTCTHITITDTSFFHCGAWCMHLKNSREIFLSRIHIQNDKQDGFDLDSCQNVSISDCQLECGDDAIAITTSIQDHPARNITITNCLLKSRCAGIRFGPLSKGDFENISVSNCIFYDCVLGGIKLGVFEGATIRNCVFSNLVMDQVSAPISIFIATWPSIGSTDANPPMMPPGKIHDLQFRGIRAITRPGPPNAHPDGDSTMFFQGHPQSSIENILLEDINITFSGGGTLDQANRRDIVDMNQIDWRKDGYWTDHKTTWGIPPAYGLYARHINGLVMQNVTFQLANPDQRPAVFLYQSNDTRLSDFTAASDPAATALITAIDTVGLEIRDPSASPSAAALLRVEGAASRDILVSDPAPGRFAREVVYANGAKEQPAPPPNQGQIDR